MPGITNVELIAARVLDIANENPRPERTTVSNYIWLSLPRSSGTLFCSTQMDTFLEGIVNGSLVALREGERRRLKW